MPKRIKGEDWNGACPVCGMDLNELNAMLDKYNPRPIQGEVQCSECGNLIELSWSTLFQWVIVVNDGRGCSNNSKIKMKDWDRKCPICKGVDSVDRGSEYHPEDGGYYCNMFECNDCKGSFQLVYRERLEHISYVVTDSLMKSKTSILEDQSIGGRMAAIRKVLGG